MVTLNQLWPFIRDGDIPANGSVPGVEQCSGFAHLDRLLPVRDLKSNDIHTSNWMLVLIGLGDVAVDAWTVDFPCFQINGSSYIASCQIVDGRIDSDTQAGADDMNLIAFI